MFKADLLKFSHIKGNFIYLFTALGNYTLLHPSDPTYMPPSYKGNPSILQLFLKNQPSKLTHPNVLNDLSSGRLPIICKLVIDANADFIETYLQYSRSNWEKFKRTLS